MTVMVSPTTSPTTLRPSVHIRGRHREETPDETVTHLTAETTAATCVGRVVNAATTIAWPPQAEVSLGYERRSTHPSGALDILLLGLWQAAWSAVKLEKAAFLPFLVLLWELSVLMLFKLGRGTSTLVADRR